MSPRARLGVLVSGGGTNLQALLDATSAPDYPAQVAVVLSNVADAKALERARRAGVPAEAIEPSAFGSKESFDAALVQALRAARVDWVCLAGYMRLLGRAFLEAFEDRVLNIHPALLPAFPGLHGPRQALAYGVKIAGCTVHLVDSGTDTGPIIAQAAVEVLPDDDEQALAERILAEEHRLYPLAVRRMVEGGFRRDGRRVLWERNPPR